MRLGFTGHQDVPPEALAELTEAIRVLAAQEEIVLITSLAVGADQTAAHAVVAQGGRLEVVIPCENYESTFTDDESIATYLKLVSEAERVSSLPFPDPSESAFMAAGVVIAERCDEILAVWDGEPSRGLGGTADVVEYAHQIQKRVTNLWPQGLSRA